MRPLLLLSALLILCHSVHGQQPQQPQPGDIVKTQGITSPLHQTNIGRIAFTNRDIPLTSLKPADFLSDYELTNKSDLFITVFMGNSLTNYLHTMEPGFKADSLTKLGGYQFALSLDGHPIYKSNITGAPYPIVKDTETVLTKPLINNREEGGWWSQYFWMRFLHSGGDSALTEGRHRLELVIRPYLKLASGTREGDIIASGTLNLLVHRNVVIDPSTIRLNPIKPYDGLPISNEKFDTEKIKTLKGQIEAGVFKHINGIIVLKNGKLLIEEYFDGDTRDSLHDPRSVGKSFASTITGIAIHEGYLKNEMQPLKDFYDLHSFANYSPEKEQVTLKDLLTMCSAFDGDDNDDNSPGNEENMYPTGNWVKFTLDLPVSTTRPRDLWHYFTAGAMLTGDILDKTVPDGLEKYADRKLFAPLGIRNYHWMYTPQHVANTAGGIRLKALDFAKYGQLYKNNGVWQGKQILPKEWIAKTFTRYKTIPWARDDYYGYFFWNHTYHINGKACETYYCSGNGGNKIFVFKDQPLVIVVTASAYGQPYAHPQVDRMMTDFILPAVIDAHD